jgi:hypothetical protein
VNANAPRSKLYVRSTVFLVSSCGPFPTVCATTHWSRPTRVLTTSGIRAASSVAFMGLRRDGREEGGGGEMAMRSGVVVFAQRNE